MLSLFAVALCNRKKQRGRTPAVWETKRHIWCEDLRGLNIKGTP